MLSTSPRLAHSRLIAFVVVLFAAVYAFTPAYASSAAASCAGSVTTSVVNFTCVNKRWTYVGDLTLKSDLVISGVDRAPYVQGNISAIRSADIILRGSSAGINATGCIDIGQKGRIIVDWSKGWPPQAGEWTQVLVTQGSALRPGDVCRGNLIASLHKPAHEGCARLESTKDSTNPRQLKMTIKTSKTHCHMVIGLAITGGIIAALVVGIILFAIIRRVRSGQEGYMAINN